MLRIGSAVVLAITLVVGQAPSAVGQETKTARGAVTAIGPASISVKAGEREMTFAVDPKTTLTASGAGTAERKAEAAGKPGPTLADFLKVGDGVEVGYQEMGTMLHATRIQKMSSAASGGGSTSDDRAMTSNGSVSSITGTILTISGSTGGGGTFTQSYTLDKETKVVAVGAGTAAAAAGGTVAITSIVGVGDQVAVTYRKVGTALHAEQVRVTAKKK